MSRLDSRRLLLPLLGTWTALLVPSVPLSMHDCHGFVGFLAHSPLYAFFGITAVLAGISALSVLRALRSSG